MFNDKNKRMESKENHDKRDKDISGSSKKNAVFNSNISKKNNKFGIMKGLALVSQLGFTMAVPFILGIIIGGFIDRHLGTSPLFLVICILLFGASAFVSLYKITMSSSDNKGEISKGNDNIGNEYRNKKDDN